MNLDFSSQLAFGDIEGLRNFLLLHRLVHDQEAAALTAKFQTPVSTFGVMDEAAEADWTRLMKSEPGTKASRALVNWLYLHAQIHDQSYALLNGATTVAPDLSQVDFSTPSQFNDWMFVHQQMHDFEQSSLGLS